VICWWIWGINLNKGEQVIMRDKKFLVVLLLFFSVARAEGARILERITLFNPAGTLFTPIENRIEGLTIKGFLRNLSKVNLHGHTYDLGYGYRRTEEFSSIEWLAELELRYRLSPNLEVVNIENFLYDAAYDWDDSGHYPTDITHKEIEYYRTAERIIRELYARLFYKNWEFILGKQQLVWGKMDGKVIDIINPNDNRYGAVFTQDDYEWLRLPLWMINALYRWGEYYVQFLWIPDFEEAKSPPLGGPFSPNVPPLPDNLYFYKRSEPSTHIANHEWGLRANMIKGGWDMSLIYFYTWSDTATYFRRGYRLDDNSHEVKLIFLEPKHTRLHQFGLDLDKSFYGLGRPWIFRSEILYTLNEYYTNVGESLAEDGVSKANRLLSALALETFFLKGEVWFLFQLQQTHIFKYDHDLRRLGSLLPRDQWVFLYALSKSFKFTDDRLKLSWTQGLVDDGSGQLRFKVSYRLSDYLTFFVRYWGFYGHSDDFWGMYNDRDQIEFSVKYEF